MRSLTPVSHLKRANFQLHSSLTSLFLVNMSSSVSSLSRNATVLVTGSGGYLGSAISWQLLKKGFKVRGTTRTASKLGLFKDKADREFGQGKFEIAEITDLSVKGALDSALRGE